MNLLRRPSHRALTRSLYGFLSLALVADIALQLSLQRSGIDVRDYYGSWNSFDPTVIEGFHAGLQSGGGFPIYALAHGMDYVFQAGLLGASLSAMILLVRKQRTDDASKARLLRLCWLSLSVYAADLVETTIVVSSTRDPLHVPNVIAIAHPISFYLMMAFFTLEGIAVIVLAVALIAAKAGENARRRRLARARARR